MPPRALSPAEENAARMAFATLQKKKLLKVNTGRGRKPGMAPVHAALTSRKGAFAKDGVVNLSADSASCVSPVRCPRINYSVPPWQRVDGCCMMAHVSLKCAHTNRQMCGARACVWPS